MTVFQVVGVDDERLFRAAQHAEMKEAQRAGALHRAAPRRRDRVHRTQPPFPLGNDDRSRTAGDVVGARASARNEDAEFELRIPGSSGRRIGRVRGDRGNGLRRHQHLRRPAAGAEERGQQGARKEGLAWSTAPVKRNAGIHEYSSCLRGLATPFQGRTGNASRIRHACPAPITLQASRCVPTTTKRPESLTNWESPERSRTRAAFAKICIAAGIGRCGSTRASRPPRNRTRAIATCSNAADRALGRVRSADATRLRLRRAASARRSRQGRRRDRHDRRHGDALRRHPARQRHRLDDDQRARVDPARDSARGRAPPRHSVRQARRHRPERRAQRIRRARDLHLPAAAVDAPCHRRDGVLRERVPHWNTISISGYHIREAGSTALQEIAFTLANAKAYLQAARDAGLAVDASRRASRSSGTRTTTSSKRSPSSAPRARSGRRSCATSSARNDPRSQMLRFHTQTGGSTLTAQEPENNVVRVTLQALAAVLGGTQSLHTNGKDEALGLPTADARPSRCARSRSSPTRAGHRRRRSARRLVLRRVADRRADRARARPDRRDRRDGRRVAAIESGWMQEQIGESAYRAQQAIERGEKVVVGVNRSSSRRRRSRCRSSASTRRSNAIRSRACARSATRATAPRVERRSRVRRTAPRDGEPHAALRRSGRRGRDARRDRGVLRAVFGTHGAGGIAWRADRPRRDRRHRSRGDAAALHADARLQRGLPRDRRRSGHRGGRPAPATRSSSCSGRSTKTRRSRATAARRRRSCTIRRTASPTSRRTPACARRASDRRGASRRARQHDRVPAPQVDRRRADRALPAGRAVNIDPNGGYSTALALSNAVGLRPFLTLALTALAVHLHWLHPSTTYAWMGERNVCIVFGVLAALEFLGDKIPAVDHALHAVHFATKPIAAVLVSGGALASTDPERCRVGYDGGRRPQLARDPRPGGDDPRRVDVVYGWRREPVRQPLRGRSRGCGCRGRRLPSFCRSGTRRSRDNLGGGHASPDRRRLATATGGSGLISENSQAGPLDSARRIPQE